MKETTQQDDDLKWDLLVVLTAHTVLILALLSFLFFVVPSVVQLLQDFGGQPPLSLVLLMETGGFMNHPVLTVVASLIFLVADAKVYTYLRKSKGKKVATIWATSVTLIIAVAFLWYLTLIVIFANWLSPYIGRRMR